MEVCTKGKGIGIATEEYTNKLLKKLFTKRYLNKIDANEDDINAEPSFDMYDVRRLIFIAQQEAKCSGYEPYEKIARADERAKMFLELDELQEFLEADMWQAIHHKTELITEKKLQAYLQRHFGVVRKGMGEVAK